MRGATWQLTMACTFTAASCLHLASLHPNPNANREVKTTKGASLLATGVHCIGHKEGCVAQCVGALQ